MNARRSVQDQRPEPEDPSSGLIVRMRLSAIMPRERALSDVDPHSDPHS